MKILVPLIALLIIVFYVASAIQLFCYEHTNDALKCFIIAFLLGKYGDSLVD